MDFVVVVDLAMYFVVIVMEAAGKLYSSSSSISMECFIGGKKFELRLIQHESKRLNTPLRQKN